MKKTVGPIALLISITIVGGTHFSSNSSPPSCATTSPALTAPVQRLIDNDNEKNLEGVLAGYTDDAILLPPKAATITGKDAIRSSYEHLFSGSTIKLSFKFAEIGASGDLGFVRGVVEGTVAPQADATPTLVNDKFIALLRCVQGQWRVSHLMWSPETSTP